MRHPERIPIAVQLDESSDTPLGQQLYDALRNLILTGKLAPGSRLPSTRMLAEDLGVSRNTTVYAFQQLLSEGYLDGKTGAGTYVSHSLAEDLPADSGSDLPGPGLGPGSLSQRGRELGSIRVSVPRPFPHPCPFRPGLSAITEFPMDLWLRISARNARRLPSNEMLSYADPAGYGPLREAIAQYVSTNRAVRCEPEQVIITAGSQQALDLAARMLVDPGQSVYMEDPGYFGARGAFQAAGLSVIPLPVDEEGAVLPNKRRKSHPRLLYVTPSHQFPLGVVMSASRRLALLQWAEEQRAWILEDDYDSELRYSGRPLYSLQGLDRSGRVIYMGTFSKVIFPSLRLGYLVVPPGLVDSFVAARAIMDRHSPMLEQAALAEFIAEGHFARHVRRMRVLYRERQRVLVEAAGQDLAGILDVRPAEAGMHLVGRLSARSNDRAVSNTLAAAGIDAPPLSVYVQQHQVPPALLLGYAAWTPRELRRAVRIMAPLLRA